MIKFFVIAGAEYRQHETVLKFWSNKIGWVDLADASVYTEEDKNNMSLPMEAKGWLSLPDILWETFQVYQYEADAKASATAEQINPF